MATSPRRRPQPQRLQRKSGQVARTEVLPAPTGGLNDRDAWTHMPATDAIQLENWWVEPSRLVTRKGSRAWATGFTEPPTTLIEYAAPTGGRQVFVAAGDSIYDVTMPGEVGEPVVTGLLSDAWQAVAASTPADPPAGSYLYLFNGVDKPLLYDGTTWTAIDSSSTPSITGVPTEALKSGCVYKNRLFMVQAASMRVWYLPPTQVGGTAQMVDLASIFGRGGYVAGVYTWTLDAGAGSDDHIVILTSNGEAAVYTGVDPSDVAGWQLIGVYYLGEPIGDRPAVKFGGDLLVLCEQGVVPLSQALLTASIDRRATITDKIQNTINQAIQQNRLNPGWQLCPVPSRNALILNVPDFSGAYQFVQNTITGAWTTFRGWNIRSMLVSGGTLYVAAPDGVRVAWEGDSDSGNAIVARALQAFSVFRAPAYNKYFTMVRPYLRADGNPSILFGLSGDYNPQPIEGTLTFEPATGAIWGQAVWGDAEWGGSTRVIQNWSTVGAVYQAAAPTILLQNNNTETEWSATALVFEVGGVL